MKSLNVRLLSLSGLVAALILFLLGCAAIKSARDTDNTGKPGLAYYLPKGMLRLVVVKEVVPPPNIQRVSPYHTNVFVTNQTTFRQTGTNTGPVTFSDDGLIRVPLPVTGEATNLVTQVQSVSFDSTVSSGPAPPPGQPTTKYYVSASVEMVQDRDQRYLLNMKPSVLADDYMKIGVSNGFLQTLVLSNADQTLSVLSNLAKAAVTFVQYAGLAAAAEAVPVRTTNIYYFDPCSKTNREEVINTLSNQFGIHLDLPDIPDAKPDTRKACANGIFYRQPLTYYLRIRIPGQGEDQAPIYLPNASPVDYLEFSRAAFVSQSYMVVIRDGMPYEVALNKPSQAAAVSTLPITVANALLSVPLSITNVLQFKVDVATAQNKLAQAQAAGLSNDVALVQATRQLEAALKGVTNSPPGSNQVGAGRSTP